MIPISYVKEWFYISWGSIEYYDSEWENSVTLTMKDDWAWMFFSMKSEWEVSFNDKEELMSLIDDFYERFRDIPNTNPK